MPFAHSYVNFIIAHCNCHSRNLWLQARGWYCLYLFSQRGFCIFFAKTEKKTSISYRYFTEKKAKKKIRQEKIHIFKHQRNPQQKLPAEGIYAHKCLAIPKWRETLYHHFRAKGAEYLGARCTLLACEFVACLLVAGCTATWKRLRKRASRGRKAKTLMEQCCKKNVLSSQVDENHKQKRFHAATGAIYQWLQLPKQKKILCPRFGNAQRELWEPRKLGCIPLKFIENPMKNNTKSKKTSNHKHNSGIPDACMTP